MGGNGELFEKKELPMEIVKTVELGVFVMDGASVDAMPCYPHELAHDAAFQASYARKIGWLTNHTAHLFIARCQFYDAWVGVTWRRFCKDVRVHYTPDLRAMARHAVKGMVKGGMLEVCRENGWRRWVFFWRKVIFPTPLLIQRIWEHQQELAEKVEPAGLKPAG